MKIAHLLVLAMMCAGALSAAKTLDLYTIDVEGGKAVLVVSPSGQSMLVDVGWAKSGNREGSTEILVQSAKAAGLKQIDYLLISHYDGDHMGDVPALVARFPVLHIVDHGPPMGGKNVEVRYGKYADLFRKIDHTVVKPGDRIPLRGVDVRVLTAAGKSIEKPLKGAGGPTASCNSTKQEPILAEDAEDNASVGLLFTFGKFRMVDLADLEAHNSFDLACPVNLIGKVDVYHVNVHGQFKGMTPVLLDALRPRVAIMGNGARKGGDPPTWPMLRGSPGLEDIWQSHFSVAGGKENNPPENFIANSDPKCRSQAIKISARRDGVFTVTTGPGRFSKTYRPRTSRAALPRGGRNNAYARPRLAASCRINDVVPEPVVASLISACLLVTVNS